MPLETEFSVSERLNATTRSITERVVRHSDHATFIFKRPASAHPSATQITRFHYAYEVQKRFDHPGITRVVDLIQRTSQLYIVLEDTGAISLDRWLLEQPGGRATPEQFFIMALQIVDAIDEIHRQHVVHRDLHPGNILLHPDSLRTQITDFELSTLLDREQASGQIPAMLEGSLPYMSPEQTGRMNRSIDHRSDFYSLGVLFFRLLCGRLPFEDESPLAIVHAHIARPPPNASTHCAGIPRALSDIIAKLLSKNAESRYQSASGLRYDLEKCHILWKRKTLQTEFMLGINDLSDKLQISQKLYGREKQTRQLLEAFERALNGNPQLLTVTGYSGIGKSSLVQEAHKPIAAFGGWFIAGKFDPLQKHIPFTALQQALKQWVQMALADARFNRETQRDALLAALGNNARVLIDLQPDMAVLLGDLTPLPPLGPIEAQNRFYQALQQFFDAITQQLTLVLFLDDLQWADTATLNFLKVLMREQSHRLLLVLAWRDNEVHEGHLTRLTVQDICRTLPNGHCDHITLTPLTRNELQDLLRDSLRTDQDLAPLAALIHEKTAGNPFFVNEFLRSLHRDRLLQVDHQLRRWIWSIDRIREQSISDNVIDLMIMKLRQLPQKTQTLLQRAACIGGRFDSRTLEMISPHGPAQTRHFLWPALQEGLLRAEGNEWNASTSAFIAQPPDASPTDDGNLSQISYAFIHDRMQQAAYESLAPELRPALHLTLARAMTSDLLSAKELSSQEKFARVEHYHQARHLIIDAEEHLAVAAMNLEAARQARRSGAWVAAMRYSDSARSHLPANGWINHYELTANTHLLCVECGLLIGNSEEVERLADHIMGLLQTRQHKLRLSLLLANGFIMRGKGATGITIGLNGLVYADIHVPTEDQLEAALTAHRAAIDAHPQKIHERIFHSSELTGEVAIVAELLSVLLLSTYVSGRQTLNQFLAYKGIELVLEHGLCDQNLNLLSQYVMTQIVLDNAEEASILSKTVIERIHASTNPRYGALACLYSGVVSVNFEPFEVSRQLLLRGHEQGLENGDITTAVGCFSNITMNLFAKGDPLADLDNHLQQLSAMMQRHQMTVSGGKQYKRLVIMLRGETSDNLLDRQAFDDLEWQIINQSTLIAFVEHLRLQWYFWSEQLDLATTQFPQAQSALLKIPGFAPQLDHPVLVAMTLAIKATQLPQHGQRDLNETLARLEQLESLLQQRTRCCSSNNFHKQMLVRAEHARLGNNTQFAIDAYRQAIQSARTHGFTQYEALAQERLGDFLMQLGWNEFAVVALKDAYYLYGQWGCVVKQKCMARRYDFFYHQLAETQQSPARIGSVSSPSGQLPNHWLDVESIVKANQTLSSELQLDKLLSKLLDIMIENAGAQIAALVLNQHESMTLIAKTSILPGETAEDIARELPCAISDSTQLPAGMVRYVMLTNAPLNSNTPFANDAWQSDPYISRYRPASILCLPIRYRERVNGVLYLENRLATNAFINERIDVLQLLLTQAAISLENAQLFNEVQQLNSSLEQKVYQRTAELQNLNKELEAFSYSVSHDLRSPIRNINGFAKMLMEQYRTELGNDGCDLLHRITRNTEKMANLSSGLLELSKVARCELNVGEVDLALMANNIAEELQNHYAITSPHVARAQWHGLASAKVRGDSRLLYSALENLLNNAWKYSARKTQPCIEFGQIEQQDNTVYFVRDNGAGFDMRHAEKLFVSFHRLHHEKDFTGTGIGLATVYRIIHRHGGEIWAEALPDQGATFYFTLASNL